MIQLRNLWKRFPSGKGEVLAVRGIDLDIPEGAFTVLLGPSGCGKTTTLRCIAGLEQPDEGTILIRHQLVYSSTKRLLVPPEDRPVAMVFQSYALWPHMDVFDNIVFPLRHGRQHLSRNEAKARADSVISLLKLEPFVWRRVTALSGGQQQRVALARALSLQPHVLLMDEPLSNLDAKLRAELRIELKQLIRKLSITAVYVTHDQSEALSMGDTVSVMEDGLIVQQGTPTEIYERPQRLFTAQFLGDTNFIPGILTEINEGEVGVVETVIGKISARFGERIPPKSQVVASIRVEDVQLGDSATEPVFSGVVREHLYYGNLSVYLVEIGQHTVRIQLPASKQVEVNQRVSVQFPLDRCFGFPVTMSPGA